MFRQFSTSSPDAITWNIDSQGSIGICCQYKRPSGSSLPSQTVPTRAANIGPARLEWRFGLSRPSSAFEDCQLEALHSSPRNGLLFVQRFLITVCLSQDRKVIITCDVCSGQPPPPYNPDLECVQLQCTSIP